MHSREDQEAKLEIYEPLGNSPFIKSLAAVTPYHLYSSYSDASDLDDSSFVGGLRDGSHVGVQFCMEPLSQQFHVRGLTVLRQPY